MATPPVFRLRTTASSSQPHFCAPATRDWLEHNAASAENESSMSCTSLCHRGFRSSSPVTATTSTSTSTLATLPRREHQPPHTAIPRTPRRRAEHRHERHQAEGVHAGLSAAAMNSCDIRGRCSHSAKDCRARLALDTEHSPESRSPHNKGKGKARSQDPVAFPASTVPSVFRQTACLPACGNNKHFCAIDTGFFNHWSFLRGIYSLLMSPSLNDPHHITWPMAPLSR